MRKRERPGPVPAGSGRAAAARRWLLPVLAALAVAGGASRAPEGAGGPAASGVPEGASAAAASGGHARGERLELHRLRWVDEPGRVDFDDPAAGDLRSRDRCGLPDGTVVEVRRDWRQGTDTILVGGAAPARGPIVIDGIAHWDRVTLECDTRRPVFYHGHPVRGLVQAFRADGTRLWEFTPQPFRALAEGPTVPGADHSGHHGLTAVVFRQGWLLVEWLEIDAGFRHAVHDAGDGRLVAALEPAPLIARTAATVEDSPWWVLFWGESRHPQFKFAAYVPRGLYELRVAEGPPGERDAARVLTALQGDAGDTARRAAVAPIPGGAFRKHVVALLTPSPASATARIEFCPATNPELARMWLGPEFDREVAFRARDALLGRWRRLAAALAEDGRRPQGGPLDDWFRREVLRRGSMQAIWERFDPADDAWVRSFQLELARVAAADIDELDELDELDAPGSPPP